MRICSENSFVDICAVEIVPAGLPAEGDMKVVVKAVVDGFSGELPTVWLGLTELRTFLSGLASLEKNQNASAILTSHSPEVFSLRIYALDSLGHLGLEISLCRTRPGSHGPLSTKLGGSFELGAIDLSKVVSDFKCLPETL